MNNFEQRIGRALHEQAEADVPAVDLWSDISAQLTAAQPRRRSRLALPTTGIGRLSFVVAVLVMLSGAAWAVPGLRDTLFETLDGLWQVKQAGLTHKIEQSQTIDGVTVTLHEAYADAKRIAVGVTVKSVDGKRYIPQWAKLDGRNGTLLSPGSIGMEYSYPPARIRSTGQSDDSGEVGVLVTFNPTSVTGSNGMLDLRLSLYPQQSVILEDEQGRPIYDSEASWVGPFDFDFSVPFNTGETIEINQTQQAAGVTMTLKRINVLPSTMDAVLCFDQPTPGVRWWPDMTLFVDDLEDNGGFRTDLTGADAGCVQESFELSGANASGWVLRVDRLSRVVGATDANIWPEREEIVGPWEFHYPRRQPAPVPERGDLLNEHPFLRNANGFDLRIERRDGGLMYQLVCREAKSYLAYRLELFDQRVATHDQGPHGPVQHCATGQVLAAGGPIMPPGPLPLQFDVQFEAHERAEQDKDGVIELIGYPSVNQRFIWDADGQLYYEK